MLWNQIIRHVSLAGQLPLAHGERAMWDRSWSAAYAVRDARLQHITRKLAYPKIGSAAPKGGLGCKGDRSQAADITRKIRPAF
jgi:hypothetical protein